MQFKNIIVALFAGTVTAVAVPPGGGSGGDYEPCPSLLYSTALCCATDVGGVLGLDCKNGKKGPAPTRTGLMNPFFLANVDRFPSPTQ